MTVDLLNILALLVGGMTLLGGIWQVAQIKSRMEIRIIQVENNLNDRLTRECDRLSDLLKEYKNQVVLKEQADLANQKSLQLQWASEYNKLRESYESARRDLYDVQTWLQKKSTFRIKINTQTLAGQDTHE
ncbi:MAG: hypothetical protein AAGF26_02680 [Cyanobacteria bacterium P01_G01_bin.49]